MVVLFTCRKNGEEIELVPVLKSEFEVLREIATMAPGSVMFARRPYVRFLFRGAVGPVLRAVRDRGVVSLMPIKH